MLKYLALAGALLCLLSTDALARQRHRAILAHPDCNLPGPNAMPCEGVSPSPRGERIARSGFGTAQKVYTPRVSMRSQKSVFAEEIGRKSNNRRAFLKDPDRKEITYRNTVSGIVAPLAAKVAEIVSSCGSQVVSGVRHTYIAGTRHISLHASGKAVDLAGNPSCIYAMLSGWPGGYSTDYARMRHVHLSYDPDGGREMGIRFVHGGGRTRHAHRRHHHQRFARAG